MSCLDALWTATGTLNRFAAQPVPRRPRDLSVNLSDQLVIFVLERQRFALRLPVVQRIVRIAAVDTLPKAPPIVLGVVNVGGRIVPVVNLRQRFRLPESDLRLTDHLLLARTTTRELALLVDGVIGVVESPASRITAADDIVPGLEYVHGVAKLPDGLVFIHDLETLLSLEENRRLDEALA